MQEPVAGDHRECDEEGEELRTDGVAEGGQVLERRPRIADAERRDQECQGDGVGSLKSCKTTKEAYAVRRTVPPSAEIEARIEHMLSVGVGENPRESLSELAKLGARLIIQRAVEDEFDAWLGRSRYERRPESEHGLCNYG